MVIPFPLMDLPPGARNGSMPSPHFFPDMFNIFPLSQDMYLPPEGLLPLPPSLDGLGEEETTDPPLPFVHLGERPLEAMYPLAQGIFNQPLVHLKEEPLAAMYPLAQDISGDEQNYFLGKQAAWYIPNMMQKLAFGRRQSVENRLRRRGVVLS
jgi:hypothetical protein